MMITTFLALWVAAQPASALLGRFFKPPASSLGKVRARNPEIPLKTTGLPPMNTDNKGLQNIFYQNQAWKVERLADVKAGEANIDFVAPLELWVRNIRDVYSKNREELDAIKSANRRHRRLVELNVIQQCINVMKTGVVQKRRQETYLEGEPCVSPLVHAMVFDPKSGNLKRLNVDFTEYEEELTNVYGLHLVESA